MNLVAELKRKGRSKRGYTFVELIVVIVIIMILAGGGIFGIVRWVKWSEFKKQNEYARSIFVAAQNQLTEYSESGQLEKLQSDLNLLDDKIDNNTTQVKGYLNPMNLVELNIIDSSGKQITDMNNVWPESDGETKYQGQICSIVGTAENYQQYKDEKADTAHTILYDIIVPYLYDPAILDNAVVCLEFTPSDGQVYSVEFSSNSSVDDFTYDKNDNGKIKSIVNRSEDERFQRMVGYYGVDTLYKSTSVNTTKPSISKVSLNNEETLNLSFKVSKAPLNELMYEIKIYDKDHSTSYDQIHFQLDASKFKKSMKGLNYLQQTKTIVYKYSGNNNNGQPVYKTMECNIMAYLDEKTDNTLRIVLDGADQSATSVSYYEAFSDLKKGNSNSAAASKFIKTASFHRFGVDLSNIYCKVQATGTYYKTSAAKTSNSENVYFASDKCTKANDVVEKASYTIRNARHLYNIRYAEDIGLINSLPLNDLKKTQNDISQSLEKNASVVEYQIADDFSWESFYKNGWFFKDGAGSVVKGKSRSNATNDYQVKDVDAYFPSISELRSTSVITSSDNKKYTISGLKLDAVSNPKDIYIKNTDSKAGGLFLCNKGTIEKFAVDQIQSVGSEDVGTICAVNEGTLSELEVKNSKNKENTTVSFVKGTTNVGGIAGKSTKGTISSCVNDAIVSGASEDKNSNIGGIVGYATANNNAIELKSNQNYGQIQALNKADENIGGIVGKAETSDGTIMLENCNSSLQYSVSSEGTNLYVDDILNNAKVELETKLNGVYVGGIIGYNAGASLDNCSTKKNRVDGYVLGNQYVGGIIGYNETTVRIVGKEKGRAVNEAHVLGKEFVGGIVGSNITNSIVMNWENRGFVGAVTQYAGGIAGYNDKNAYISNCSSEAEVTNGIKQLRNASLFKSGSYVGGITGYNDGRITKYQIDKSANKVIDNTLTDITTVSDVTGNNFVGGIVGYNDVDAEIDGYAVIGGNILGTGSYVGGFAGFNSSVLLLQDNAKKPRYISANPNTVEGQYCVGGIIGANILALKGTDSVNTIFDASNFLGAIKAETIAGGFIGYNRIIGEINNKEVIKEAVDQSAQELEKPDVSFGNCMDKLPNLVANTSQFRAKFTISGKSGGSQSWFGGIEAKLYAAGVVAYNDDNTTLTIQNVTNRTSVTAKESVPIDEEGIYGRETFDSNKRWYSYSGGIIGKVTKYTTLDNCKNEGSGYVTASKATYTGGLCEINEGTIKNCQGNSLNGKNYVGGIVGINNGTIDSCTLNGNLTGDNYIGGITSENFGMIKNCSINNSKITARGDTGYVGMITAYNDNKGTIQIGTKYKDISVSSNGDNVGGLIGDNHGKITANGSLTEISGFVTGNSIVGGMVGNHTGNSEICNVSNSANVTAVLGTAGGIAGQSSANIENCSNAGVITAAKSGNAGGIIADNNASGTVSECEDIGSVIATNGICGGIVATNEGIIVKCSTIGKHNKLRFESLTNTGGICAENSGTISNSNVDNLVITNITKTGATDVNLGAIAGINKENAVINNSSVKNTELKSATNQVNMGGITGYNQGTISDNANMQEVDNTTLTFSGSYANVGGAVGINETILNNIEVSANITGTDGTDDTGYGGIAGVNNGRITSCQYNGKLNAVGKGNAIANIGGIAGKNNENALIKNSTIGTKEEVPTEVISDINSGFSYIGGITGWNYGHVESCDNKKESKQEVKITTYKGHIGGIVGFQAENAVVTGTKDNPLSSGKRWMVTEKNFSNDCGAGGIIGYNESGVNIQYVDNYANVEACTTGAAGSVTAGGLIGRSQNKYVIGSTIKFCNNYGSITSGKMAGGLVGRVKYKPFSFEDCENYGNVQSMSADDSAGILGGNYMVDVNSMMHIIRCKNFGDITGVGGVNRMGGIMGANDSVSGLTLVFSDCVNLGSLYTTASNPTLSDGGGIAGKMIGNGSKVSFYKCRNYGNGGGGFYGITPAVANAIYDCFSIGNQKNIAIPVTNSDRNYYLDEMLDSKEQQVYVTSNQDIANMNLSDVIKSNIDTNRDNWNRFSASKGAGYTINFMMLKPVEMDSFNILMANNNDSNGEVRTYSCKATIIYADGEKVDISEIKDRSGVYKDVVSAESWADNNVITVPVEKKKAVSMINVEITKVTYNANDRTYTCFWGAWAKKDGDVVDLVGCSTTGKATIAEKSVDLLYKIYNNSEGFALDNISIGTYSDFYDAWKDKKVYTNNPDNKGIRQLIYESIEEGNTIENYYNQLHSGEPKQPTNLTINVSKNVINCSWTNNLDDPAYYGSELQYKIVDTNGKILDEITTPISLEYGVSNYQIPVELTWVGKTISVSVRAVSSDKNTSNWLVKDGTVKETLAKPIVHVELVDTDSFMCVLDNLDDYKDKNNIKITANVGNIQTGIPINLSTGKSDCFKPDNTKNKNENITVSATAEPLSANNQYATSDTMSLQTVFYNNLDLSTDSHYSVDFQDFYGDLPDELSYKLSAKKKESNLSNMTEMYVNTDFQIEDYQIAEGITLPVVVSYGMPHVTFATNTATQVELSNLPKNMLSKPTQIAVQTYPWMTQSYAIHYGHEVMTGIAEDDLIQYINGSKKMVDTKRGEKELRQNHPNVFNEGKLNQGYIVRLNTDGTYDVLYSSILNYDVKYKTEIYAKKYTVTPSTDNAAGNITDSDNPYNKSIYQLPAIADQYSYDDNSYTFKWNQEQNSSDAEYEVRLYGVASDNEKVLLDKQETKENTITFKNPEQNWNYAKMILEVTQKGTVDKEGKTEVFPARAEKEFAIKLRFSQVMKPATSLHREEDNTVQKNTLMYDVNWVSIPDTEKNSKELSSYEISVKWKNHDSNIVKPFTDAKAFVQEVVNSRSRYESKDSNPAGTFDGKVIFKWNNQTKELSLSESIEELKEYLAIPDVECELQLKDEESVTYKWSENSADKTIKLVLQKTPDDEYKIEKQLDEIWKASGAEIDSCKKTIDLCDYERGDTVSVSVRAIAKNDAVQYRDGQEGVVEELILPARLDVPDVSVMTCTPVYDQTNSITMKELEDGLQFTYNPTEDSISASVAGKYQLAIAVFDEQGDDDTAKHSASDWKSGSETVIAEKDEFDKDAPAISMDGNFYQATELLEKLSPDYAGKWLKIVMRSVSDSNISSYWSDEDDIEEGTLNYCWIQVPRVQIPSVEVETTNNNSTTMIKDETIHLTQTMLSIGMTEYEDLYHISRVRSSKKVLIDNDDYTIKYIDEIYLKKSEDNSWDVYFTTSDPSIDIGEMIKDNCLDKNNLQDDHRRKKQNEEFPLNTPQLVYLGALSEDGCNIPSNDKYYDTVSTEDILLSFSIKLENNKIQIVLPDLEKMDEVTIADGLFTDQVSIQAMNTKEPLRYADSKIYNWYRGVDSNQVMTIEHNLLDAATEKSLSNCMAGSIVLSDISGYEYQMQTSAGNWLVYWIKIKDGETVLYDGYVSAAGNGVSGSVITNYLLLSSDRFKQFPEKQVEICGVAAIQDVGSGEVPSGLSKWVLAESVSSAQLPKREDKTATTIADTSSEDLSEKTSKTVDEAIESNQPNETKNDDAGTQESSDAPASENDAE